MEKVALPNKSGNATCFVRRAQFSGLEPRVTVAECA